jgi:S-adenosylmethionine:tRNA ribosyltransferase-isomerase
MKLSDFTFSLPEDLIAQQPAPNREDSRLLVLDRHSGTIDDKQFKALPGLLLPGDLLVFNDSRVIPARLFGQKDTGGKVEILVERVTGEQTVLAQIKASKTPKPGTVIFLDQGDSLTVVGRQGELYELTGNNEITIMALLERHGHMPLPPYIRREDTGFDRERYQTVYARQPGAVAAPTAGLHFTTGMIEALQQRGINTGFVTLHIGAGTFKPVRAEQVTDHVMHTEWYSVDERLCAQIATTRANGGRIIAVGTTVVRCLESAAASGTLQPVQGETGIFIYPGYTFRTIDGLITNFHLPESTLLMLVCAFAGMQHTLDAYKHAVEARYRFFSYGDAMLIL